MNNQKAVGSMAQQVQPDATTTRAWQTASALVHLWPELTIAWADWYEAPDHLVVSGSEAALHFMSPDGPTLETATAETQLDWAEVDVDADNVFAHNTWAAHFGAPEISAAPIAKTVVYSVIAELLRDTSWTARPAKIMFATEDPLEDPDAVFGLLSAFPSLMTTVQWYASQVSLSMRRRATAGRPLGWHEPLWQVARQGQVIAIFDEGGRVHLPRIAAGDDNSADLIELVADEADWVAGGLSFDILVALNRLDGELEELVELITPGARHTFGLRRAWNPSDPNREQTQPRRLG